MQRSARTPPPISPADVQKFHTLVQRLEFDDRQVHDFIRVLQESTMFHDYNLSDDTTELLVSPDQYASDAFAILVNHLERANDFRHATGHMISDSIKRYCALAHAVTENMAILDGISESKFSADDLTARVNALEVVLQDQEQRIKQFSKKKTPTALTQNMDQVKQDLKEWLAQRLASRTTVPYQEYQQVTDQQNRRIQNMERTMQAMQSEFNMELSQLRQQMQVKDQEISRLQSLIEQAVQTPDLTVLNERLDQLSRMMDDKLYPIRQLCANIAFAGKNYES